MSDFFDIYTLLFLVLAIVIFLRLRAVLGRRTGHERPPFNPYEGQSDDGASQKADGAPSDAAAREGDMGDGDNVITLPRRERAETKPDWSRYMTKSGSAEAGLNEIAAAAPGFEPKSFLEGARSAYEMIVTAFANGDQRVLKTMLSKDVLEGFAGAIAEREARGERADTTFIGIDDIRIADAALKGRNASLTLSIESKLITAVYDKAGKLIDGDKETIIDVNDIWTFARDLSSRDPNWTLVATEAND